MPPTSSGVHHGRVDAALVARVMPDAAEAIAMMCGPQPMIDAMREALVGIGLPPDRVRSEVFEAVTAVTRGTPRRAGAKAQAVSSVRCTVSDQVLRVSADETLLDAAEAAGLPIDSLCRSGVCGTCRTRVLEGDVECQSSMLDAAERQAGFVLACVSHVLGDCAIEA
jgi:NADH oxidoreductase Hcr